MACLNNFHVSDIVSETMMDSCAWGLSITGLRHTIDEGPKHTCPYVKLKGQNIVHQHKYDNQVQLMSNLTSTWAG